VKTVLTIDKRINRLRKHYHGLLKNFNPDEIHDFRLEIKKLRAFMRLAITDEHRSDLSHRMKSFYHLTGDTRNLQLHQDRIKKMSNELFLPLPEIYLQQLKRKEYFFRKKARETSEKISLRQFEKNCSHIVPAEISSRTISQYTMASYAALLHLLATENFTDDNLHDLRKKLKDLLYNREFIEPFALVVLPVLYDKEKTIDHLTEKLGDFHDLCLAVEFMQRGNLELVVPSEMEVLLIVFEKIMAMKKQLKRTIIETLREIDNDLQTEAPDVINKSFVENNSTASLIK
jgi:CHAD domain-containing protein